MEAQEATRQGQGRWPNRGHIDPGFARAYVQRCADRHLQRQIRLEESRSQDQPTSMHLAVPKHLVLTQVVSRGKLLAKIAN